MHPQLQKMSQTTAFDDFSSFFLKIYPSQNFQFPQDTKGLETRHRYLSINLPSNQHIMDHTCLSQMRLMHCIFVEYFPYSLRQVLWGEVPYIPTTEKNTQA